VVIGTPPRRNTPRRATGAMLATTVTLTFGPAPHPNISGAANAFEDPSECPVPV